MINMPEPVNTALYARVRSMADRKFGTSTGLYKSAWMVHEYVKMGGRYKGKRDPHHGIVAEFKKQRSPKRKSKSKSRSKSRSR